jgi:hypothetical protein
LFYQWWIQRRLGNWYEDIFRIFYSGEIIDRGFFFIFTFLAIEARRMDKIKEAILSSNDPQAMLEYCTNTCLLLVSIRDYRHQVSSLSSEKKNFK